MDEILPVIQKADKFKNWLSQQDVDADVIKEYYREVAKESVIDRLPAKSTRWATFTAAGLAADALIHTGLGTATGVALSALDAFFLDRLLKGWKPSQFIEDNLAPVLRRQEPKQ